MHHRILIKGEAKEKEPRLQVLRDYYAGLVGTLQNVMGYETKRRKGSTTAHLR